jgi:hypothetical protein
MKITVSTVVAAPLAEVWRVYTSACIGSSNALFGQSGG